MTPITDRAAEIDRLTETLCAASVGAVVTYADLSAAIGRDITRARYLAHAAIKRANTQGGAVFGTVYRVGFKRLSTGEVSTIGSTARPAFGTRLGALQR